MEFFLKEEWFWNRRKEFYVSGENWKLWNKDNEEKREKKVILKEFVYIK